MPEALAELSRETGESFGAEGALPQIHTERLQGRMTVGEALAQLLVRSGYLPRRVGANAWRIERGTAPSGGRRRQAIGIPPTAREDAATIVVTGTKRRELLSDLPMALAVVRPDRYTTLDPNTDTSWLSGEVEGLSLTNLGPGRNRMFLRGVADSPFNGESQSTVAVVLDDSRMTYAAPDPDIRLIDVARVEVLKGPQGALYGTGALGGIYHIVTNRAKLDELTISTSGGIEAVAGGGVGYSGSGVLNLPLVQDRAALRLVGYTAHEPGWIDTGARTNANASQTLGLRAGLGIEPGDGWRLDLTGFGQWLNSRDSQYVYAQGARSRPAQLAEPHDNDLRHLSARVAKRFGSVDMVLSSGLTWHEVGDTLDATVGAQSFGLGNPTELTDDRHYRVWDSEARFSGRTAGLDWLAGLSHVDASQQRFQTLYGATSSQSLDVYSERRSSSDTGLFTDVTVPVSVRLKLSLGARAFHTVLSQSGGTATVSTIDERERNGVTPAASLSWTPHPGRLFFIRYGSAFRQGGIAANAMGAPAPLRDDELSTLEAGWREELSSGGRLDVGAYFTWWENLQSDVLLANGLIGTQTAGNARIAGLEASIEQPIARGWTFEGGATVVRARLISNALGIPVEDSRLPVVPDFTVRGAIEHEFRVGSAAAAIRMQLRYLGPAHLSFDEAIDRPMGNVLESNLEGRIDLAAFSVTARIENLLDRANDTFAFGNSLRFTSSKMFAPQRPTSFIITLIKDFK